MISGSKPQVAVVLAAALALLAAALFGCGRPEPGAAGGPAAGRTVRMIGSTTVLPLGEKWREDFNKERPEVEIAVSGGGSGTGIKALISGTAEIAMSSREIKDDEVAQAIEAGVNPVERIVAYDGIAVIVHPSNPVAQLSVEDLSDIYTGEIADWKAVGVRGRGKIQVISRDSASGTYEAFKDLVVTLDGKDKSRDYAPATLKQASNQAVLTLVAKTKNAVGYVGLGYVDDTVKPVSVVPLDGSEPVAPMAETIMDGSYPVSRELYCYTDGEPSGPVEDFVDWIEGPEGQRIVAELGFVPVR